jgi:uncharacterized membrane protein
MLHQVDHRSTIKTLHNSPNPRLLQESLQERIFVFSPLIFWPCFLGLLILIVGLFYSRREIAAANGLDKLIALAFVFVAAPLATFAGEHFSAAKFLMEGVPRYMPFRLFCAYFVGVALLAAALSFSVKKCMRWSAPLLATMFFLFVLMMDLPAAIAQPHNRLLWTLALREIAFGAGALALTGFLMLQDSRRHAKTLISIARICIGIPLIFYGIQHFLYPRFAPGVPLPKLTPSWVPLPFFWAYLVGAVLLVAGIAILLNKGSQIAATCVGLVMTLLTLFLYTPILAMITQQSQIIEGVNYVADTLFFGGTVLFLAMAIRASNQAESVSHLQ